MTVSPTATLGFGIPNLDRLLGRPKHSDRYPESDSDFGVHFALKNHDQSETLSICIMGPNGTGKSILALHLASEYFSRCRGIPYVIYVSTDLSFERANRTWETFGLHIPHKRQAAFRDAGLPAFCPSQFDAHQPEAEPIRLSDSSVLDQSQGSGSANTPNVSELLRTPGEAFVDYFLQVPQAPGNDSSVLFLDLASQSAGDDWALINRIATTLEPREHVGGQSIEKSGSTSYPALLIIDAVEGLEVLVGDQDAFGEPCTRRSRVAQLLKCAARRCHVVLVCEEPAQAPRLPEEFVADVVLKLNYFVDGDYSKRTVEVEKVRGQWHARGRHPYAIRTGRGSKTGAHYNPDDPKVPHPAQGDVSTLNHDSTLAYIQVLPSLHYLTRTTMRQDDAGSENANPPSHFLGFGLRYLDELLASGTSTWTRFAGFETIPDSVPEDSRAALLSKLHGLQGQEFDSSEAISSTISRLLESDDNIHKLSPEKKARIRSDLRKAAHDILARTSPVVHHAAKPDADTTLDEDARDHGLPGGSITTLFGEEGTHKDRLARAFLAQAFSRPRNGSTDPLKTSAGVAALLTTADHNKTTIAKNLNKHLADPIPLQDEERIVCRRLETHNLSTPELIDIVRSLITRAQAELYHWLNDIHARKYPAPAIANTAEARRLDLIPTTADERRLDSWRIRFVIDDLTMLAKTYPSVKEDPLFLPYLCLYLQREGVTTLIVDTQAGNPTNILKEERNLELRAMAQYHLYTWHVLFYGERRVAITAIPSIAAEFPTVVREIRPAPKPDIQPHSSWEKPEQLDHEGLYVDPHFEIYDGLEDARAVPVQLLVRLFAQTPAMITYVKRLNMLFQHLFVGQPPERAVTGARTPRVVRGEKVRGYDLLREFTYLQSHARLPHTLVQQVDEFWSESRPDEELRLLDKYLRAHTVDDKGYAAPAEDPFGLFQPTNDSRRKPSGNRRMQRADFFSCPENKYQWYEKSGYEIDKVPYMWDFGFLLCDAGLWNEYSNSAVDGAKSMKVYDVWKALPRAGRVGEMSRRQTVGWGDFLRACDTIARKQPDSKPGIFAFDIDVTAPETFSCLALEVWISECLEGNPPPEVQQAFNSTRHEPYSYGLLHLLSDVDQKTWRDYREIVSKQAKTSEWVNARRPPPKVDTEWFRKALYRALLLLKGVLGRKKEHSNDDQFNIEQHLIQPRVPESPRKLLTRPSAVATRHWYSTACAVQDSGTREALVPVALPGYRCIRGDWFLAIAKGSRSPRLGERGIDLLSSRRANMERLELGLGLPVRGDVAKSMNSLRTRLNYELEKGGKEAVTMGDLRRLGARDGVQWLWRSTMTDYDRHARLWHKWLCDVLFYQEGWSNRESAFNDYDKAISGASPHGYSEFLTLCESLVESLRSATNLLRTDAGD